MSGTICGMQTSSENNKEAIISLLIASFLALFLELAFIRWLPANVLSLAYFSNVVLISSFLGLGLGMFLSRYDRDLFKLFPFGLLAIISVFLSFKQFEIIVPIENSEWIWSYYGKSSEEMYSSSFGIFTALTFVFIFTTALFAIVGQKIGRLLNIFQSNKAYMINVAGSLLGVVIFGFLSFAGSWFNSPAFWFTACGFLSLWFFRKNKKQLFASVLAVTAIFFLVWFGSKDSIWSPYYSIQHKPYKEESSLVFVNRFFHQKAVNFNSDESALDKYGIPYRLKKPNNILVLGAGTGNDVAAALTNGVKEIDAVEIDPSILQLGKNIHPNLPFDDPRVRTIVDDARSFLKRTDKKYDMIVLGTLDSHALLSGMSTVRLDNFVYTLESMKDINGRLSEDGVVVLMFSASSPQLKEKLLRLVYNSFDHASFIVFENNYLFNLMIFGGPGAADIIALGNEKDIAISSVEQRFAAIDIPTDDWPYLYLSEKTIPFHYIKAILILLAISFFAVAVGSRFKMEKGLSGINFFALGSAFLLLETKSITTLSLLFGSTWLVNIFVFSGILLVILFANYLLLKRKLKNISFFYILLGGSLTVNYFIHPGLFLANNFWLKSAASTILIALPLFFAAFIFAFHVGHKKQLSPVLGINLLGAVFGGFLEYSSMLVGLNNLYIIATMLYFISFLSYRHSDRKQEINA